MSHFTVMVIGNEPEKQLAPYHEYECTGILDEYVVFVENDEIEKEYEDHKDDYATLAEFAKDYFGYELLNGKWGRWTNPNRKWDWYVLGGRWKGMLLSTNGRKVDAALKGNIDFKRMEEIAADKAGKEWDKVHKAINKYPSALTWEYLRDEKFKGDIDTARKVYNDQPQVKAFAKVKDGFFDSLSDYQMSREDYVINAAISSYSTFALVKDSKWYEKGEMGWFGMSSDKMTQDEWNKQLRQMIKELPDDTLISIYDCHI